jgi:N6-L-threonylcarbamoyladenine synthase
MKNISGQPHIILGIETSCDETAAAVMQKNEDGTKILSNIVASSMDLQAKYGGIVPEQAARQQLVSMLPVVTEALKEAEVKKEEIDAIAVTQGPGLIGSLLIGMETAKVLALTWEKPLVPVNHLIGHFYANWISPSSLRANEVSVAISPKEKIASSPTAPRNDIWKMPHFPAIGLLVSGGHTDLILMEDHGKYKYLGGTRDDAAGEAFDKTARLLGLPYPGGPVIARLATEGNPQAYHLPRPMADSPDLDFSFSGLKTAVLNLVESLKDQEGKLTEQQIKDLAASIQEAVADTIVKKTIKAAQINQVEQIIVAGGVAANQRLKELLEQQVGKELPDAKLFVPPVKLCTDNAAYIAAAAFFNYHPADPLSLQANPNLSLLRSKRLIS